MYSGTAPAGAVPLPPTSLPVRHSSAACHLVELTVLRLAPDALASARRALHGRRAARLLRVAREHRRRLVARGVARRDAGYRARRELERRVAGIGWRDELALVADDVLARHATRVRAHAGHPRDDYDVQGLVEALARDVLVSVERLTGLVHAGSDVPAVAVRAALDCLALPVPDGAALVALLDRAGDDEGRLALEHRAAEFAGVAPGLVPALLRGLARAAVRADGFDADADAVRDAVERASAQASWHREHALYD